MGYGAMIDKAIELGEIKATVRPLLKSRAKVNLCDEFGKFWMLAQTAREFLALINLNKKGA